MIVACGATVSSVKKILTLLSLGRQGPKGLHGDIGRAGIPGRLGVSGDNGDLGDAGLPGLNGRKGFNGRPGPYGLPGLIGLLDIL